MSESSSSIKHDMQDFRRAISEDAMGRKNSNSGHVILNWLQVGLLIISMVVPTIASAVIAWYKLDSLDGLLHEVKGAQEKNSVEVQDLKNEVKTLSSRAAEERTKVDALERQMSYRLAFEAHVRAIHPETQWP